jgi:hypothetical protein
VLRRVLFGIFVLALGGAQRSRAKESATCVLQKIK